MRQLVVLSVLLLITGCAGRLSNDGGYVQFHSGEALHPSEKVIIEGRYAYRDGTLANEMTRIVEINGESLPREWGVAPGANKVSLVPGYYEIKILYVHGSGQIDYYTYSTVSAILKKNCTYQIVTKWSSLEKTMFLGLSGRPTIDTQQPDCSVRQPSQEDRMVQI
ncbi:hypothetical protein [Marinobacter mobilis]|uniref:DUF2846 domain-containing protein n=1 Tax=Marinobacter mobilis TaxID=488533 RepID=A0A1H3BWN4_9GAMM|nr:hypothetical protein [Marinobacter mobilis]SDX45629.1 hypothetical protein SAMN04487960_109169 [Marinobacter mobilis]